MNWKNEAVALLKDYPAKHAACYALREQDQHLSRQLEKLNPPEPGPLTQRGPLSQEAEDYLRLSAERALTQQNLELVERHCARVERGLQQLAPQERQVLEGFYISPGPFGKDDLMDALHVERSALYERKEQALRHFTLATFGLLES